MKLPTPRWDFGTLLYRKASSEEGGTLVGYVVRPDGRMTYLVDWAEDGEAEHFEIALSDEKTL